MALAKKTTSVREALRAKAGALIPTLNPPSADRKAIDNGRNPLPASPTKTNTLPPIESRFQFSAADSDRDIPFLQVESLLDHASELLDRCRAERAQYDLLRIEHAKLQADIDRFHRIEEIQARERKAGSETLAYERAILDQAAENTSETLLRDAETQIKDLLEDLLASGFNKRMTARELTAWITGFPLKDHDLGGDNATYTFDGVAKSKPDHLYEAARVEADEAAWELVFSLMSSRYALLAQAEAAKLRGASLNLQADFSKLDIGFRSERDQLVRDAGESLAREAQSPGSAFHFEERMEPIEHRFSSDFRDALAHLDAARRGLKTLFDYEPAFPKPGSPGYFDQVALWTGNARNRLAQVSRTDQTYVLAISLKDAAKSGWEAGQPAATWSFDLPQEMFKGQSNVRLRGIALAVAGPKPEDPADKKGAAKKVDAPDTGKAEGYWTAQVSLPNPDLPPCFFGAVADREAARPPEIAGANALYNANPVGKGWKVSLSAKSTDGMPTEKLRDIMIYLHVAVQNAKARS